MKDKFKSEDIQKNIKRIDKYMPIIEDAVTKLTQKKEHTEQEEDLLKRFADMVLKIKQYTEDAQLVLGDKLYRQSVAYYFHVKELGEKGNEEAKKIYEDLKPQYDAGLLKDLDNN